MRFSSIMRRKSASGCGPSLDSVRIPTPPPAVLTAMCSPPRAVTASPMADSVWFSSRTSTSWKVPSSSLATSAPADCRQVEDGDVRALLAQHLGGGLGHARRAAADDGLLALDLHCVVLFSLSPRALRAVRTPQDPPPRAARSDRRVVASVSWSCVMLSGLRTRPQPGRQTSCLEAGRDHRSWLREFVGGLVTQQSPRERNHGTGDHRVRRGRQRRDRHVEPARQAELLQRGHGARPDNGPGRRSATPTTSTAPSCRPTASAPSAPASTSKGGRRVVHLRQPWNSFDPGMTLVAQDPPPGVEARRHRGARDVRRRGAVLPQRVRHHHLLRTTRCSSTRTPTSGSCRRSSRSACSTAACRSATCCAGR